MSTRKKIMGALLAVLTLVFMATLPLGQTAFLLAYLVTAIVLTYMVISVTDDWRWWFGLEPAAVLGPPVDLAATLLIPARNEEDFIAETLQSAKLQTRPFSKIIVVDDCSDDRTGDIARGMGATVIRPPGNQGSKARAINYALELDGLIETPLVVTVDADTTFKENAVEETLRYFRDPRTAVVCGYVTPKHIRSVWERGRFIEYLYALSVMKPAQNHHHKILVVSGCFAVFRTGLLRQTGGFKDRTKAEDMDYTWDLQGTEYYAYYTPHAECYPEDPYDFKTYYKQVYRWQAVLLQNIRVRNARWFWKRKAFSFMVFSYLLMNLIGPAASLLGYASLWGNLWWGLGTMYAVQGLFVWLPAFLAARRKGLSLKALTSIPAFAVIQFVNMGIFMRVLWMEWVRRKTLSTWEKGHRKVLAKD